MVLGSIKMLFIEPDRPSSTSARSARTARTAGGAGGLKVSVIGIETLGYEKYFPVGIRTY